MNTKTLFIDGYLREQVEALKPKSEVPNYYKKNLPKGVWASCTSESFDNRDKTKELKNKL